MITLEQAELIRDCLEETLVRHRGRDWADGSEEEGATTSQIKKYRERDARLEAACDLMAELVVAIKLKEKYGS